MKLNGLPPNPTFRFPIPILWAFGHETCIIEMPLMTAEQFEFFKARLEDYREAFVIEPDDAPPTRGDAGAA